MRQETERLKLEHLDAAQKAISSNANEMNHYKNMISSLRDEIDQKKILQEEDMLQFTQNKELELKQLQETIFELRSELDKYHGK